MYNIKFGPHPRTRLLVKERRKNCHYLRSNVEFKDPVGRLHPRSHQSVPETVVCPLPPPPAVVALAVRGHEVDDAVLHVFVGELPHLSVTEGTFRSVQTVRQCERTVCFNGSVFTQFSPELE